MPDTKVLADLLGEGGADFRGPKWPDNPLLFHSNPEWFQRLSSLDVLRDPEQWLDRAPSLLSFLNADALTRSEARRRYLDGETIHIFGLDLTVKPLRDLCDGLAADLSLDPRYVMIQVVGRRSGDQGSHALRPQLQLQSSGRRTQTVENGAERVGGRHPRGYLR
jgi:hypothetical protein